MGVDIENTDDKIELLKEIKYYIEIEDCKSGEFIKNGIVTLPDESSLSKLQIVSQIIKIHSTDNDFNYVFLYYPEEEIHTKILVKRTLQNNLITPYQEVIYRTTFRNKKPTKKRSCCFYL